MSEGIVSQEALLLEFGKTLTVNTIPFLMNPYIVEEKLIPFIQTICDSENPSKIQVRPSARVTSAKNTAHITSSRKLNTFLDIMMAFSEVSVTTPVKLFLQSVI